jgi:hypothetical protein
VCLPSSLHHRPSPQCRVLLMIILLNQLNSVRPQGF